MPEVPILSARQVIKALAKIGYEFDHQRGSHIILRRAQPPHRRVAIPNNKELPRGTLRAIIAEVGLSVEQFLNLLG
jgi:predicted RNA binding protein YcfA (HicA-like mRNA interferase family)